MDKEEEQWLGITNDDAKRPEKRQGTSEKGGKQYGARWVCSGCAVQCSAVGKAEALDCSWGWARRPCSCAAQLEGRTMHVRRKSSDTRATARARAYFGTGGCDLRRLRVRVLGEQAAGDAPVQPQRVVAVVARRCAGPSAVSGEGRRVCQVGVREVVSAVAVPSSGAALLALEEARQAALVVVGRAVAAAVVRVTAPQAVEGGVVRVTRRIAAHGQCRGAGALGEERLVRRGGERLVAT
jgi:hypothetical protein